MKTVPVALPDTEVDGPDQTEDGRDQDGRELAREGQTAEGGGRPEGPGAPRLEERPEAEEHTGNTRYQRKFRRRQRPVGQEVGPEGEGDRGHCHGPGAVQPSGPE